MIHNENRLRASIIGIIAIIALAVVIIPSDISDYSGEATKVAAGGNKNSCSDTDGGNMITLLGTVKGYNNRVYQIQTDQCINSGTIREFYCNGATISNQQQLCGTDYWSTRYCVGNYVYAEFTDYVCSGGACSASTKSISLENCLGNFTTQCVNGQCV